MAKKNTGSKKPPSAKSAKASSSSNAKIVIWAVVAVALVALGWFMFRPAGGGVQNVDAAETERLAAEGVRVVDVRSPGEFAAGHIDGAINVNYTDVAAAAPAWDPNEPILIYCATGERSDIAVQTLESQGFTDIYHFDAGLVAWSGPLVQGAATAAETPAPLETAGTPVMYELYSDN